MAYNISRLSCIKAYTPFPDLSYSICTYVTL